MRVELAKSAGFCYGVRRAVELAEQAARSGRPCVMLGPIIHNGSVIDYLKDGDRLLIFPEGTRHQDGDFGDAKTGAAMLALRTGVPIIPIYLPAEKKFFRSNPVVFGEAYYPQTPDGRKPTQEDYRAVADDLMARIEALKPLAGR